MLHVYVNSILLIIQPLLYRFRATLTKDDVISGSKTWVHTFNILISIKCLKHLLTIVYVNIEMCCICMWTVYCWLFPPLFYRFRATWTKDDVVSGSKPWVHTFYILISIKCLKHLLTIVDVNMEMCCRCMWTVYCWFFPLSFTGSVPLGRATPSSPAQNREYILSIYDIQLNALSIY